MGAECVGVLPGLLICLLRHRALIRSNLQVFGTAVGYQLRPAAEGASRAPVDGIGLPGMVAFMMLVPSFLDPASVGKPRSKLL